MQSLQAGLIALRFLPEVRPAAKLGTILGAVRM
jgi:hypothetical protein